MTPPARDFPLRLQALAEATEQELMKRLADRPENGEIARPARLLAAMRHAASGGKRIRAFLVVETAALFGVEEPAALPAAAALEAVHAYSLVHDDLPSMDNDDLRRGQPTVHRAFDEATAILAGDGLLTLAFEILAGMEADADTKVSLISLLARASGIGGMLGGQMLDLEAEGRFASDGKPLRLDSNAIEKLQAMKTGALLAAACKAGAILGRANERDQEALARYARALGLAFQIADDLLDAEGDAATLGKATAKDAERGKATLVSLAGIPAVRARLATLVAEAEAALAPFGGRGAMLQACVRYVAERDR